MARDRSRSPPERDRRRRSRERDRERERRRRRDRYSRRDRSSSEESGDGGGRRGGSRRGDRSRTRSRSRDTTPVYDAETGAPASSSERKELLWDKERERLRKKEKDREIAAKMAVPSGSAMITDEDMEGKTQEEMDMMRVMGFGSFDTTKNKKVKGNNAGDVHIVVKRKYRQYMNRKGGFNRPLDFVH